PSTRSQFMARSFPAVAWRLPPSFAQRERKNPVAGPIFLCDRAGRPHIHVDCHIKWRWRPELLVAMLKDDIVSLLPDLRAFARFMCREREAADDLVQNTILAALDKQAQFEPGTNLKGWLFTIMRNRFYSDLRAQ